MKRVEVYSIAGCIWCVRAKDLLDEQEVPYTLRTVKDARGFEEMVRRTGGPKSFPQIFVGGMHVGGFQDLQGRFRNGEPPFKRSDPTKTTKKIASSS
jgi:glutaredoxin 3